jgi:hypothetical protein
MPSLHSCGDFLQKKKSMRALKTLPFHPLPEKVHKSEELQPKSRPPRRSKIAGGGL